MRSSTMVALAAVLGLTRPTLADSPPATPAATHYELDLLISGRTVTVTPVSGCTFASLSATCGTSGPCSFLLGRSDLSVSGAPVPPRFSVLVDPDGFHAVFTCHASACTFTFPAAQGQLDVRRVTEGQSTVGLLKARATVLRTTP